jgi:uncharacterized membrane protein
MRVSDKIEITAPSQDVWDYLAEPENYLRFMSGVTRWEIAGQRRSGLGSRYRMLIRVGAAEVGGLIEFVEWTEPRDMAWTSVTGVDQRGRWRIRTLPGDRCTAELRYAYGIAGAGLSGWIAEHVAVPTIRRHIRRTLRELKRQVEHERLRTGARRGALQNVR